MPNYAKIVEIDGALAVLLPPRAAAHLKAQAGDEIVASLADDALILHRKDAEFEEEMRLVDEVSKRYRNTLAALAKS